ncbi:Uncharacterised protein [Mycobacteroides abscessus subsp. abscessus]|uniref:hypothetical protein n=1 Tax=Mycobacteroides abscessus TaxID=36809 RepID=UPI00092C8ED8|nr:hypothetical protein [Mycobacteroides abscessus]SHV15081.1 Uncharacterised protein [Mycobacteroides abscessus subsp. abscessus]SKD11174.1 Uncharacterised protein [Mycobacteroides abscessus subsp. abscessus]SKL37915.1 Uncharacterised protein [Mycobacteroides abscessus subsp. abscessus]SKM28296.1 Uncharacterised protein [Mycobacteroides abscessus subsp. abscessus]
MTFTDQQVDLIVAGVATSSAVVVALLSAFIARIFVGRDRRRQMYGEAFRAGLEWREMLYRVRRRANTADSDQRIKDKFHDLQERLAFHEGWIGSESKYMRRSYCKFVKGVRDEMQPLIQDAWRVEGAPGNAEDDDSHPKIGNLIDAYLRDVRAHLSLQPWRWAWVAFRNWSEP